MFYGSSIQILDRLQRVHNNLARVVCKSGYRASSMPLLKKLHWLPVRQRITYKIATITFKAFRQQTPKYLKDLIHKYVPNRTLRSADSSLLMVPTV